MMARENDSYSKSTGPQKEVVLGQLSFGKLVFLCIIALALGVVGPLSIFAPLPLAVAFLLYGLKRTFLVSGLLAGITYGVSMSAPGYEMLSHYAFMMVGSVIFAVAISSIIMRGENPVKGLISRGILIFGVLVALVGLTALVSPEPLTVQVEKLVVTGFEQIKNQPNYLEIMKAGGEPARDLEAFLSKPKELVNAVFESVFAVTFVGVFFVLWLTLFMLLRNGMIWREMHDYRFGLKDLVRFKAPDFLMYFVILGFALFIGGEYLGGKSLEVVGANILWSLGVFYFFQGMGIYLDLLKFLKITGLLRSILTVMTIFLAFRFVAIVGLFDLWADFRKYFKRKEN